MPKSADRRAGGRGLDRLIIESVSPELDGGRYSVKRAVGDVVWIGATVLKEGHDELAAHVLSRRPNGAAWLSTRMQYDYASDRWYAPLTVDIAGTWTFAVEAWTDEFATWRRAVEKKTAAGVDVSIDLLTGARIIRSAARALRFGSARATLQQTARVLEDRREHTLEKKIARALEPDLALLMDDHGRPADLTRYRRELTLRVDRSAGARGAWYELFPRSQGAPGTHGTFNDAANALPRLARLGFDVVYLPPIHPIGRQFRKGKNNSLNATPDDVGSPWAIGNEHGGHTSVEPALGTLDDFDRFVAAAATLGLEVALDYALQCSPDHPWVREHPDWFVTRPDGTIAYAENPPKKYQDIYPLDFWCADRQNLWNACRDILTFWIDRGVKIFRVDNPHTKALAFWEWVIRDVQVTHPDVLFLAEAFTRPALMFQLAKLGFTMSYTYFTWKNTSWELRDYFQELTSTSVTEFYRGNLFANTPDILHQYLVSGGKPAFRIRLLLAATLSPLYGIYAGFEFGENAPVRAGSEEYLDSEKYEIKHRPAQDSETLEADIALLNEIRREQPALMRNDNLSFLPSDDPAILWYRKAGSTAPYQWNGDKRQTIPPGIAASAPAEMRAPDVFVAVCTDPHVAHETTVSVPVADLGIAEHESYGIRDLLTGARYTWRGTRNYIRIDPAIAPGHVFIIER